MSKATIHVEYLSNYRKEIWGPLMFANPGDCCFDLRAAIKNSMIIRNEVYRIPTGIKVAIPTGYELQIRARSGFAYNTGCIIVNSPGTIDSGYRGEICILLVSLFSRPVQIRPGDRIAQAKLAVVPEVEFEESFDIESAFQSVRGSRGFGSTGID